MVTRSRHDYLCVRWLWSGISILMELELAQKILLEYRRLPILMALAIMITGCTIY